MPLNERRKRGRKLRRKIGRGDNADWSLKKTKRDPVAIILAANSDRLRNLVPIKMGRMAAGPFAFFRGAAPLMAAVRPEPSANGVPQNSERAKTGDSQANGRTSVGRNPTNTPSQQIATCETVELAVGDKPITRVADLRT